MSTQQLPFLPPNLNDYVDSCWVEGYFTKEEVQLLNKMYDAKTNKHEAEVSNDGKIVEELRKSTVSFLEPNDPESAPFINKLAQLAIQTNAHRYKFDLLGFYEPIQIAEYKEGDFFDWHLDYSQGAASTRKLSLSVQLTEPDEYEGGDLQFMVNTNHVNAPRTIGTVIIFPSFIMHRVTPITEGKRRSMVGWVTGYPYR